MLTPRTLQLQQADWASYMAHRATNARDPRLKKYYQSWHLPADLPVVQAPLVALDLETTGLDVTRHAIVSLGLVPFTMQRIHFSQHRHWLVRPSRPLNEQSVKLHHITHSDLAQAPDLNDILDQLLEELSGRLVVVHYRNIERHFINQAIKSRINEELLFPVIDTMSLEAQIYRQPAWERFKHWLGITPASIRLHDSRLRYGLPGYQAHNAVADALATAELLQAQISHRYTPQTPINTLWS